jgi:hypothetical protein
MEWWWTFFSMNVANSLLSKYSILKLGNQYTVSTATLLSLVPVGKNLFQPPFVYMFNRANINVQSQKIYRIPLFEHKNSRYDTA